MRTKDHEEVVQATKVDLSVILGWLEHEYQEDGNGFWCNRRVITKGLEKRNLWMIRDVGPCALTEVMTLLQDHLASAQS